MNQDIVERLDAIAKAILSGDADVQSYTNSGSAGGTFYYAHLGQLKLCWGSSNTSPSIANNSNWPAVVTLPSSFFNTILAAVATPLTPGDNRMGAVISAQSISSVTVLIQSLNAGSATSRFNFFAIGT